MAKISCTPFCDSKKPCPKHHELLVSLLNYAERGPNCDYSQQNFEKVLSANLKNGWRKDDVVPDPVKEFQFPLIHWATVLGKAKAIELLIQKGFNPAIQAEETKETALHRFVLCLNHLALGPAHKISPRKINIIISCLESCLTLRDSDGDTPLLVAAKTLVAGRKPIYFEECIEAIVGHITKNSPTKLAEILNIQDLDGNTALHILARNDISFVTLRTLLQAGADASIVNFNYETPYQVALACGSTRNAKLLDSHREKKSHYSATGSFDGSVEEHISEGAQEDTPESLKDNQETCSEELPSEARSECPDDERLIQPVRPEQAPASSTTGINNALRTGGVSPTSSATGVDNLTHVGSVPTCTSSGGLICTCIVKKEYDSPQKDKLHQNCMLSAQTSPGSDGVILEFLRGAGLLDNVKELAMQTKSKDEQDLHRKLQEIQATQGDMEEAQREIEKKKTEIEKIKAELEELQQKTVTLNRKRKSLSSECSQLQKKLHYCDSVLQVVPPGNNNASNTESANSPH
ncbi:predicted protein [Nematostella vectensis]|uniref:Uncharacterized protein n=1 Tax=Nematostella vectensis TaxID=45351 RepID=A7S410_NEMVE|nr:uncharacterized protein LOC5513384 [Nematostella vectensis]EDO41584.1 predicted protein [Nematostella vectensis]|eukprot:XP_001633647.1 predicted protein [Nematostella vectensis]